MSTTIKEGKGYGYLDSDRNKCMIECFECGKQNAPFAVATGRCSACGFDANRKPNVDELVKILRSG
jgi:ribosomal protein L37E